MTGGADAHGLQKKADLMTCERSRLLGAKPCFPGNPRQLREKNKINGPLKGA